MKIWVQQWLDARDALATARLECERAKDVLERAVELERAASLDLRGAAAPDLERVPSVLIEVNGRFVVIDHDRVQESQPCRS